MYRKRGKRIIDCILSSIGVLFFMPLMLIITIAIKLDSKGPALFQQKRLGKNQEIFTIYKFRTMCVNAYEMGGIVTDSNDTRITRVGAVLRRTSLDELPQLINILKGEMSIIGPRPILPIEFKDYQANKKYKKRFRVLPGLFCTVDIVNRAAEREQQFKMDADYAENISLMKDILTFFRIIKIVIIGENVYHNEVKKPVCDRNRR